ncbi:excinuclease ABC subunit UvrC [Desulfococcaceae bacterium HSG8]|nr:excinuclease ABC subunit UvrC [Desulfococcaceae bacterium HSG8]
MTLQNNLNEKLSRVSTAPGVYLMKDTDGKVIYVGKARNLKKRLASYFNRPEQPDMKTGILVKKIATFETIITETENEALILESNLIKKHRPKYNVILKDGKRYPSLRLDTKSPYPNLRVVRKPENDGALYFGPFSSAGAVHKTLKTIDKMFRLRKCKTRELKKRSRPCLNHQIGACLGPCCLDVDPEAYSEMVREVMLFLKGRTPDLIRKTKTDMDVAARARDYEAAAMFRDRMFALEKVLEKQVSVTADFKDRDVLAAVSSSEYSVITMLFVRGGHLLGTRHFSFTEILSTDAEMVGAFIRQYYEKKSHFIPKEILIPDPLEDALLIEEWLKTVKGEKVRLLHPQRGEKALLLQMARRNAENELKDLITAAAAERDILTRVQKVLKADRFPEHIECFDNSNISGTSPVAGMVVFKKGKPCKSSYRKYKIRTVTEPDDYATMAEVLKRRYGKGKASEPYPDILMVDGGRGQLNIAVSVITELNLAGKFEIIGVAKKDKNIGETEDKIYKPGRANPVSFGRQADLLLFLQRIRDEAHRFAISFHRKSRGKASIRSALDDIPGIGQKRKQILLKHFGSIRKIREASPEEISALPGMNRGVAEAVKERLAEL